jgi:hypothetical protein
MHICEKCNKEMKEETQDIRFKGVFLKDVKVWVCECGNEIITDQEFKRIEKIMVPFTWTDKMDERISQTGILLFWLDGKRDDIQQMVQDISHQIGHKLDWAYQAGGAYVMVDKDGNEAINKYLAENPAPWGKYNCRRI